MENQDTKKCPFCGEEINVDAKKCKHCGEWLEEKVAEEPKNIKCPYCGEEILSTAMKCKHCGEWLKQENINKDLQNINNPVIYKLVNMQKTSNILWIIVSIIMILGGFLIVCFHNDRDFLSTYPYGAGFALFQGIGMFILGIYNIIHIPNELPEKILKTDSYVVKYYENCKNYIIALVLNLTLFWLGVVLICLDLYIRSIVMKNKNLFVARQNQHQD